MVLLVVVPATRSLGRGRARVRCRAMEHDFHGPSYTIGIEEELMIVDAESYDLVNAIESLLEDADGRRDQARAHGVGARDRDRPARQHRRGRARSCARCARRCATTAAGGAWRSARPGRTRSHVGGPADRRAPALPRARHRAALRRAPGADLRHARPRGRRRPRQGDPRGQRDARAPRRAARPERQLAVLARRRHRPAVHAHADLPRLPRVGIPPHYGDWADYERGSTSCASRA